MAHTSERLKRMTITVPETMVKEAEALLAQGGNLNRSRLMQDALKLYLRQLKTQRLEAEAAKLASTEEEALAEESLAAVNEVWPEYNPKL